MFFNEHYLMSKASKIWCFCFASYISKARMTLKCGSILVNECFSIESFRLGKCYEHYWVRLPLWYFVASCPKPGWQKPNELGATLVWVQRLKKSKIFVIWVILDPILLAGFWILISWIFFSSKTHYFRTMEFHEVFPSKNIKFYASFL